MDRRLVVFTGALLALLFGTLGHTAAIPTPEQLEGGRIIDAGEAKQLLEGGGAHFIDTRSALNYGRGHLPGARLIPYTAKSAKRADFDAALDRFPLTELPANPDATLIFYSHGDTGWKSYKGAVQAIRAGYRRVMWMRPGFAAWQAAGYPVE